MKTNKLWSILLMFVFVLGTSISLSSCGKDDKDDDEMIVEDSYSALLPGVYEFSGNIAPSFTLYKDGTCQIRSNGLSGSVSKDKWQYEKTTQVLLVGTHVYTIKMLTKDNLVAEWSSVKYGISTTSWDRKELSN